MLDKLDFKELLLKMKRHFSVNSNRELAIKLGLSEDSIKNWNRKNEIPQRYLKLLDSGATNINNGNNNIQINGHNHGQIHINSSDEMSMEICKCVKRLSEKKKEYFYHLIKAELIKEEQ